MACGSLLLAACGGDDDGEDADTTVDSAASDDSTASVDSVASDDSVGSGSTAVAETASTEAAETTATTSGELEYVTDGATVLVANASRVDGGAGGLTDGLVAVGYTTADPVNSSDDVDKLDTTQIFYVAGDAAAQAVADNLRLVFGGGDITVGEVAEPAPTESGNLGDATVLVLMGNDVAGQSLEDLGSSVADSGDSDDAEDDAATTEPPTT